MLTKTCSKNDGDRVKITELLSTVHSSNETTSQPITGPTVKNLIASDVWVQT
jgi:hypothetical protein